MRKLKRAVEATVAKRTPWTIRVATLAVRHGYMYDTISGREVHLEREWPGPISVHFTVTRVSHGGQPAYSIVEERHGAAMPDPSVSEPFAAANVEDLLTELDKRMRVARSTITVKERLGDRIRGVIKKVDDSFAMATKGLVDDFRNRCEGWAKTYLLSIEWSEKKDKSGRTSRIIATLSGGCYKEDNRRYVISYDLFATSKQIRCDYLSDKWASKREPIICTVIGKDDLESTVLPIKQLINDMENRRAEYMRAHGGEEPPNDHLCGGSHSQKGGQPTRPRHGAGTD